MKTKRQYVKHGLSKHPVYRAYKAIFTRLNGGASYKRKEITICEEWKNDFILFYNHVINLDNYDPLNTGRHSHNISIDRIDNSKGYFPGNIRWATKEQQYKNSDIYKNSKEYKKTL